MLKNIVLDMGNVLLDYNPWYILDRLFDKQEDKDIIFNELFNGPEWIQGDLGYIKNSQRYDTVSKRVPRRLHDKLRECVDRWDICMIPLDGAKEFCEYIKDSGYGIYILSNACSEFYNYFTRHFDLDFFDGVVVSSDIHIIKPDLRIYKYLLNKYNLNAKECLFIDDRQDNVEGALKSGMNAYVFKNNFEEIKNKYLL